MRDAAALLRREMLAVLADFAFEDLREGPPGESSVNADVPGDQAPEALLSGPTRGGGPEARGISVC